MALLFKEKWGYCQVEPDIPTIPVSPPVVTKKQLLAESKSRKK